MISPVKMAITADNQTSAAFKSVESGLAEIRAAARATTSSLTAMRRAAADSNQGSNAMASMYGRASQGATAAATSTGVLSRAMGVAAKVAVPLTAAMAALDFYHFAAGQARAADAMQDAADITGLSTETLSRYGHVAKMTGTDLDAITTALKYSGRALSEAKDETSQSARLIRDLGLSVSELRAMRPDAAFEAMGEAVSALSNEYDRTNASVRLFGRSGNELLPMFRDGAAGVRALKDESDRLGNTLDSRTAAAFARTADASDRLSSSFGGLVRDLVSDALPAVESSANWIASTLERANLAVDFDRAWRDAMKASPEILDAFVKEWRTSGKRGAVAYWESYQGEVAKLIKEGGIFAAAIQRPTLPGQTIEGLEATRRQLQAEGARLRELTKSLSPVDIDLGLSDESLDRLRAAADQYERVSAAVKEAAYQDWLVDQLMPTDSQAAEEAAAAERAEVAAMRQRVIEYQQLQHQSKVTWQLMSAGIENVTDQLSNNMAMALTGIRTQLIEVSDLARQLLGLAIRLGLNVVGGKLLSAIFKSGGGLDNVPGLQGPTPGGQPLGIDKVLAPVPAGRGGVSIGKVDTIVIRGVFDPTDRMAARKVASALFDEMGVVAGHIGPRGAAL